MSKPIGFRGVIAGVEYTDPAAFEKAARDAGHRFHMTRTGDWRVGLPVSVRLRNEAGFLVLVEGQVWAKGPEPRCGFVWVALSNGKYVKAYPSTGDVRGETGRDVIGKVAA